AADIIGFNCSPGPHLMLRALEKIKKFPVKPVVVKPNAGTPREHEGRNFYMTSPEYFAEFAKRFIQNGVKVIGGCCGTNPEHIKAVRSAVKALFPAERTVVSFPEQNEKKPVGATPVPQPEKSALAAKLAAGQFVTSIEITPPRGVDPSSVIEKAAQCREAGIDAINIPDGPRASARLSPMITALRIQEKSGIEAVLHYCCRDRNIIGMQSDLLGAAAAGINNILSVTGDPPKLGDYPDATAVFDIDSIGLCRIISRLNHALDIAGNPIGKPAKFLCGVGVNPGAIDLEKEMARLEQKISAGAEFIITQPVFDLEVFFKFYRIYEKFTTRIPLLAGIWPLASLRNAEFMNNEVPGAQVPEKIMERMRKKPSGEEAKNEGINIARESAREIKPLIQGLQVSAPFGNIRYALQVLDI
ncbi:MAG TPA: bifunctional homocysteine S-methyltransferase/methylenetetrahydrofolate reductase, partial [Spirochaetia bacterium]|nr:bifunctional homocysteine S-methyltransferase/methylenetetrahydrofolate reductase [Spirochaetia bacterium]